MEWGGVEWGGVSRVEWGEVEFQTCYLAKKVKQTTII